ncbi:MAG: o-succinylbenzoate synthase [Syntrophaceae bacterium]|nr:o-succinylbenzoate synthase [Syntrophaceae bacterium]
MMLKANFLKYTLKFKNPAGTSRGVYTLRDSWFVFIREESSKDLWGVGECAPLPGLSPELDANFEPKLDEFCGDIDHYADWINDGLYGYSSIRMGLETALADLRSGGQRLLYPSYFTEGAKGIPINGLIWMGETDFMRLQIQEKLKMGFRCIKLKIGALNFDSELALIREIRRNFSPDKVQIRLDANGAFGSDQAKSVLSNLAHLGIHSIEQPIMAGQWQEMAELCLTSPIPIALDEELIGIEDQREKERLIREIRPAYLILKPTLHGSFSGCRDWIDLAEASGIRWWVTSALESNVGLNAIAQWTATLENPLPQGLGTGQLYENNFPSPLYIDQDQLHWCPGASFDLSGLAHE